MNEINVRLDLTSPDGVKALRALADAFAPPPAPRGVEIRPDRLVIHAGEESDNPEPPTPTPAPVADAGSVPAEFPDAPATGAAEKPRRRRLKAEKEEDERNGKDAEYQRLAKEMPDASVEEIRAILYGPTASDEPAEVERDHEAAARSHVEAQQAAEPEWEPSWGNPTPPQQPVPTPAQAPPAAPVAPASDWQPSW